MTIHFKRKKPLKNGRRARARRKNFAETETLAKEQALELARFDKALGLTLPEVGPLDLADAPKRSDHVRDRLGQLAVVALERKAKRLLAYDLDDPRASKLESELLDRAGFTRKPESRTPYTGPVVFVTAPTSPYEHQNRVQVDSTPVYPQSNQQFDLGAIHGPLEDQPQAPALDAASQALAATLFGEPAVQHAGGSEPELSEAERRGAEHARAAAERDHATRSDGESPAEDRRAEAIPARPEGQLQEGQ